MSTLAGEFVCSVLLALEFVLMIQPGKDALEHMNGINDPYSVHRMTAGTFHRGQKILSHRVYDERPNGR
jgi:hypothetical protein